MSGTTEDVALATLAEEDPGSLIAGFVRVAYADAVPADSAFDLAKAVAVAERVNVFRVMCAHPELTREYLGVDGAAFRTEAAALDAELGWRVGRADP
jgi:hypothetical protein